MKYYGLLKIALVWTLVGIFILISVAIFAEPPELKINELEQHLGKNVIVFGVVESASYKEKVSFIDLADETGKISVVIFEQLEKRVFDDDVIAVRGKVAEYKGELEIIAEELACIRCY